MERSRALPIGHSWFDRSVACGAAIALLLVAYGVVLIPSTSRLSVAAAAAVLSAYAAIGFSLAPRIQRSSPSVIPTATWAGLAAGTVFAGEVSMEYLLLPKNNAPWGLVEFGLVFCIYLCAGASLTFRRQTVSEAMLGSGLAAVLSSIIWCIFILATFYLFYGNSRQEQVFRAEGDYDDFSRSGMRDFPAFIMEDFLGATFFHLLLGPAIATILGVMGALIGKLARKLTSTK